MHTCTHTHTHQNLDALSANNDTYLYMVPDAQSLPGVMSEPMGGGGGGSMGNIMIADNFSSSFTLNFSLLRTLVSTHMLVCLCIRQCSLYVP